MDRTAEKLMLAKTFLKEADRHRTGALADIGNEYAATVTRIGDRRGERADPMIELALNFWYSWVDERNRKFPGAYYGIARDQWPQIAEQFAFYLEGRPGSRIPGAIRNFKKKPSPDLFARVRELFSKKTPEKKPGR